MNFNNLSWEEINNKLPENFTLPLELQNLPIKEIETLLKEKCLRESGGDAAYEEAKQAGSKLEKCVTKIIDYETVQQEIEAAKVPNGELDTIFEKYCIKRNNLVECSESYLKTIDPCLTEEEREQKVVALKITKSILNFACHKNGRFIALFIDENGPECFEAKQEGLQNCLNDTMGKYTDGELPTLENFPSFTASEENCQDLNKLEKCVVEELETCPDMTPANIAAGLFRFVRKETPCRRFIKENKKKPIKKFVSFTVGILAVVLIILMKIYSRRFK